MAGNPIPGLVLPATAAPLIHDPVVSADMLKLQIWSQSVSPRMFTVGTPIYAPNGAAPTPPSDAYLSQTGRYQVSFTSGSGTLTLQRAFPNGWLSLQLNGAYQCGYSTSGVTLQTITLTISGVSTGTAYVDVLAVGW